MIRQVDVPVLIVGGGPVGLCASIFLSRQGVRSLLVERHPGTSTHPKVRGESVRTMELFRPLGIEKQLRAAALPPEQASSGSWFRTLAEPPLRRATTGADPSLARPFSPSSMCACPQDLLEPVLLRHARSYGHAELRFGHELRSFQSDGSGVSASIVERETGEETRVRAAYMIAADGASSGIRQALDIPMPGPVLSHRMSILFHADLTDLVKGKESLPYWINNPEVTGLFLAMNNTDRWNLHVLYRPESGESPDDFTEACCVDLVRKAVGVPRLEVDIKNVLPWVMAARVADRFQTGRIFLAGDAAHLIPPSGGYGMNTGIQDVHNLGWKLAAVLSGWAGPALLDTYETERRPVALFNAREALFNAQEVDRGGGPATEARMQGIGVALGFHYDTGALVPDGSPPLAAPDPVSQYLPTARPGHRAPHVWLERNGERISTIDLFERQFVLLAGPRGEEWRVAAQQVGRALLVPLEAYTVGPHGHLVDREEPWTEAFGVEAEGAVLVRPDGHVAWRARAGSNGAAAHLQHALEAVLSRQHADTGSSRPRDSRPASNGALQAGRRRHLQRPVPHLVERLLRRRPSGKTRQSVSI